MYTCKKMAVNDEAAKSHFPNEKVEESEHLNDNTSNTDQILVLNIHYVLNSFKVCIYNFEILFVL